MIGYRFKVLVNAVIASQGSMTLGYSRAKRRMVVKHDNSFKLLTYRAAIQKAFLKYAPPRPLDKPFRLFITVYFPRPLSHYRKGRYSHLLRPDAPPAPTTELDIDKIKRAIFDAGSKIIWIDDSRIVDSRIRKRYVDNWSTPQTLIYCRIVTR